MNGSRPIAPGSAQVWSVDPVRLVLPVEQWAALQGARPDVRLPVAFAVRPLGDVATNEPGKGLESLGARRVEALHRMLDVVDAAPIRVHVGSWGQGRTAAAVVCMGGDRVVTVATAGPDPAAGGTAGGAGAPSWVEVSAVWGGDVLAEVMRATHPDVDAGSLDSQPTGAASVWVNAVGSLAWAAAIRDGDADALRVLLAREGLDAVPAQVRAAVDGLLGATSIRVEVHPDASRGSGSAAGAAGGASWFGLWLLTLDGPLALRLDAPGAPGANAGGVERPRFGGHRDGLALNLRESLDGIDAS